MRGCAVDKFDAMQIFVRVVEKGSFSAVAKERGIGQPAVSKQISALEDELGTELIHRNSRSITLTEAGREFYESALRIVDDFDSATSRIGRGQTAPWKFGSGQDAKRVIPTGVFRTSDIEQMRMGVLEHL